MSTAARSSQPAASPSGTRRPGAPPPPWLWPAFGIGVALLVLLAGYALTATRSNESLPSSYGRRRGRDFANSASGTVVLGEMFKAAGHRVTTFTRLTPKLNETDVIVWAPDDFEPPGSQQREFLENWLYEGDGRVIVYIGRDYDAASAYWAKVQPNSPEHDAGEIRRRLARAKADFAAARAKMPAKKYARWFTAKRDAKRRDIRSLQGPWADGIDAKKCEIVLAGRLDVPAQADKGAGDPDLPEKFEPLLVSEGDTLAFRVENGDAWNGGQVIVVANGSWLLNYPLVNHEHRKLAARLVNECGLPGNVAFLESFPEGPPVSDKEPAGNSATLALMDVWPLNAIVIHLTILGIVFCLARSPIFGRPRELPTETAADFGKHVTALGELLARTKDRAYAQGRLHQYRELAKRDSGKSHLKRK
ncbi:MAG: hypothetical protein L0211_23500 [Planctomycetaceae bacterium]|nr:hypothetical protein [Planctomycetaceae bacterium]